MAYTLAFKYFSKTEKPFAFPLNIEDLRVEHIGNPEVAKELLECNKI
jgi:hypothetical protein